jgi:hypothetical protein
MYMLIVGVFVVPFALLALLIAPTQGSAAGGSAGGIVVFGLLAIFGYGLLGWVFTAIAAAVYNLAARWVGGIEVQIETVAPPPPMPAWASAPPAPASTSPAPPPATTPAPPPATPPAPPTDPAPPAP